MYGPGLAILFVVFVEAAGVFWFYGVDKFSADIEEMLGQKPSLYWRICWRYISPTFLFVILIFSIWNSGDMLGPEYYYPPWAYPLGWVLTLSSVICIPLYMIYKFDRTRGSFKRVSLIFEMNLKKKSLKFLNYILENSNNVQARAPCADLKSDTHNNQQCLTRHSSFNKST